MTSFTDDRPEGRIQRLRGALREIASYKCTWKGCHSIARQALANDDYSKERLAQSARLLARRLENTQVPPEA